MSRIAKLPVKLLKGVTADVKDQTVTVKGAKGSLSMTVSPVVKVALDGEQLRVSTVSGGRASNAGRTTESSVSASSGPIRRTRTRSAGLIDPPAPRRSAGRALR